MSLLFNVLSRLVITFLPRSKRLLISWLQSQSAVMVQVFALQWQPENRVQARSLRFSLPFCSPEVSEQLLYHQGHVYTALPLWSVGASTFEIYPRDRGAWWASVYGVAQSWTRLK